jgi:hypothetical protein
MMQALKKAHEALGPHPTKEALHRYNEYAKELLNECERTEAQA